MLKVIHRQPVVRVSLMVAAMMGIGTLVRAEDVAIVSHIKVISDKVPDVSSLEAWKQSFIREDMTPSQKAMSAWKTVAMFGLEAAPVTEYMGGGENCIHDAIKTFNVYGCNYCDCSGAIVACLGRYLGLEARGWSLHGHCVSELFYDNAWHLLDAAYLNYFPRADGSLASVEDLRAAAKDWYDQNPSYLGSVNKLEAFARAGGWKKGPLLLATCPLTSESGAFPCYYGSWAKTMVNYDGGRSTPAISAADYFQGYEVNIQLRKGERLIRNWSNQGQTLPVPDGLPPEILDAKVGQGILKHTPEMGDLANGRIGHGRHEYRAPLADGSFRGGALVTENLAVRQEDHADPAVHVKNAAQLGLLVIRMPSSYVYLTGQVALQAVVPAGGEIDVAFSDNNGLDWTNLVAIGKSGLEQIDLLSCVTRRYDYQLKFTLRGAGTGLENLTITHDILQSQRALPALGKGSNTLAFSAAPSEGTVTISGNTDPNCTKQLTVMNFHPDLDNVTPLNLKLNGIGSVTFHVNTPGDITRLRFGGHYRARDKRDGWEYQVSFDNGQTFTTVDRAAGPTPNSCKYVSYDKIPAGTRQVLVRWSGKAATATCLFRMCIDADYTEPHGGFRPVKITYLWEENGVAKQDVHIAKSAQETYAITCTAAPVMKSIVLELAE